MQPPPFILQVVVLVFDNTPHTPSRTSSPPSSTLPPHLQIGIIMVLVLIGCQPTVINRATGHPYGSYEV